SIPITRRGRAVIGGAVALDPCQVTSGGIRVDHRQIDPELRHADLRLDGPAPSSQTFGDGELEVAVVTIRADRLDRFAQSARAPRGKIEIMVQVSDRPGGSSGTIDHRRIEAREDDAFRRGAGDGDVQTPFSALPIEGAEVHRHRLPARRRRAIDDRKQNDVALIALHGLQVLHEDRLPSLSTFFAGYEEALELRICAPRLIEEVFDDPLLLRVEGYDADRELTQLRIVQSSNDLGYYGFRLDL